MNTNNTQLNTLSVHADKKNLKFNTVMQDLQHWRPNDLLTVRLRSKQNRTAMEELWYSR